MLLYTSLIVQGLEQNEIIGLDSPRCIRAIIQYCVVMHGFAGENVLPAEHHYSNGQPMQPSNVHSHPSHRHGRATCQHINSYIFPALSRTRVTMQRLLHGLGTQVLGQVQVASPCNTIFPPITPCSSPHPVFLDKCTQQTILVLWC